MWRDGGDMVCSLNVKAQRALLSYHPQRRAGQHILMFLWRCLTVITMGEQGQVQPHITAAADFKSFKGLWSENVYSCTLLALPNLTLSAKPSKAPCVNALMDERIQNPTFSHSFRVERTGAFKLYDLQHVSSSSDYN